MARIVRAAVVTGFVLAGGVVSIGTAAAAASPACTITWTATDAGTWDDAASWSPNRVPDADDTACLGSTARVTSAASTTVRNVVVESGQLSVAAGATLTVAAELVVSGGTLAGPGAVVAGDPAAICCPTLGSITGPARLARGVHLDVSPGLFEIHGRVGFTGGAVLRTKAIASLLDHTVLADDDADPANALVAPPSRFGYLRADSDVRVDVVATIDTMVSVFETFTLALPRLTNETPDGVLRRTSLQVLGRLALPYPVTSVRDGGLDIRGPVVVAATGAPALTASLRTVTRTPFFVGAPVAFSSSITFAHAPAELQADLSAPSLVLADASTLDLRYGSDVHLAGGRGVLAIRPDTVSGPVGITLLDGAVVDGSIDQRGGVVHAYRGHVTGDWTIGSGAVAAFAIEGRRAGLPRAALTVAGTLTLGGAIEVEFVHPRQQPAVGATIRLVTAGAVSGTFAHVTLPDGYRLSYDATGALVTRIS